MPDNVDPNSDREVHIDQTDARAGSNDGVVRWVLLVSLSLAIIALSVIWMTGALTQDAVESEGTATGRIDEQEKQEGSEQSDTDGINLDVGDGTAAPAN